MVVFALIFTAFLLYRRRRLRSGGRVRIGSGSLETGLKDFDIDGPSVSLAKPAPDKSKPSSALPLFSSLRHRISYWSTSRHRDSSAQYITAWNPRAAVHVVQLPPAAELSPSNTSSERRSTRDHERSRRRRHRKHKRERTDELQMGPLVAGHNLQLGTGAGTIEGPSSSSSPRRQRRKHRQRRERDAGNSRESSGRLRSFRNSRIMRAARNLHLAKPGSSTNGSTYAPTVSGLTSEISERPTLTLSSVSEVRSQHSWFMRVCKQS